MTRGRPTTKKVPAWSLALKLRRVARGMSQEEVAAASEDAFSQRLVSDLEVGKVFVGDISVTRASALARALGWTLGEMQRAIGVDLGIVDLALVAEGSADVYPLSAALTPDKPGLPVDHDAVTPGISRPLLLRADTDEMAGTSSASIRPGSYLHVDLAQIAPQEGRVYVITDDDGVHIRLYTTTRFGPVFRAENRSHEDIPAAEAHVVGLVAGVTSDYDPQMN